MANAQTRAALFSLSATNEPGAGGRPYSATLREIERAADDSVVELEADGDAGPAAMAFMARGFCGLMRARERSVAVVEPLSERPLRYRVRFPAEPPPVSARREHIVFTVPACSTLANPPPVQR